VLPFFSVVLLSAYFTPVLVRWLGGSFAKLGFSGGVCGFANVPPNALAKINELLFDFYNSYCTR
jgi:hypothetical protein